MAGIYLAVFAATLVASGTLAFLILWALSRLDQRQRQPSLFGAGRAAVVFLFEDERLVDATPGARQLLSV